jgi:hypothetical protein
VAGCIDVELSECLPTEALAFDKTYFWEVTAEDEFGAITTGGPWSFSTRTTNRAPNPPQALYPSPDATGVPRDVVLAWRGGDPDGDDVTYSVFKGTTRNSLFPVPGCQDIEEEECDLGQLDYSSTHYWQVDATDSHQATVQSSVWKFTVENENRPPAEATNPNPSVGATGVDTETNLTWSGGSDPDGDSVTFDVYLYRSTDAIPAGPLPQCTGLSVKVCDPGTLDSGTSYRWFVEPKDEHGAQPVITSQPWTFTTRSDNNPPYAPYDPQPSNASTNASLDPVLTWKGGDPDAGDIVTYDVYLSPDEDSLVAPLAGCANLTQKSCQPGRLESFTYYYWKVVATDKYGAMNVGGPWRFRTLNNPPGAIEPLTPADGAKDQPLNVELTWKTSTDPDGDSVKYYVYLQANDSTPEKYYPCSDLTAPRCKPSKDLEPNTKYYWFVEVQDSKGAAYRPSPAWSFTTGAGPNQPPNEPNGPSPYDGARDVKIIDSGNLLRWNGGDPDGDDVTYEVYLEVGDSTPDKLVCPTTDKLICDPGTLAYGKHYYWQVVATDEHGDSTVGEVWEFWTEDEPQPAAKIDIALIIDSSESMKWNDEDDMRKDAAKLFIGSMIDGDQVAVVAFDTSARVLWRLATLTQANRANAQAAVDQVNSDGYSTNLGAGLRAGYEQLNSSTASANPKVAVFLTDGEGDYNNEASLYIAKGWRVYTVGLGSDIDEPLLNRIALETGGQYRHLTDPNELHQVYLDIYDSATNSTTVVNKTVTVRPNQTTTVNATIAANQSSATFAIDLAGTQSTSRTIDLAQVTMELVDPSGNTIRPSSTDPAVYYDEGDTWALFRITRPQAGTWQIKLTGAALRASDIPVRVRVSQRDPEPPPPPPPPTGWQPIGSASGNGISADSSDSVRVDVAVAANGTLYAAWADEGGRIFVRKWNGSAWSDISGTGLSCGGSDARSPAIALDSGNQPIVAWSETKGNDEICIRRYSGSGTSWSSLGGGVVSNTSGDSQDAAIAVSGDGTVYVAWRDSSAGNSEIYVKRLDGSSWNEFGSSASGGGISNSANGYSGRPTIAVDGNNRPFVAYTDNYTGTRQVYVKRWTGSSWTAAGSNAAGDGGVSNNSGQSGHAVVRAAPNGTIYLTWQDTTPNQGGEIYVLRYDGSKWVSVGTNSAQGGGISNTTAATDQPALAIGPDNRPCVAWHEGPSSGPREIFARCYDGSTWAERSSSAHAGGISNNSGDSWRAKMAIDGSSNIYVLWEDNSGGGDYDIYGRRWSP